MNDLSLSLSDPQVIFSLPCPGEEGSDKSSFGGTLQISQGQPITCGTGLFLISLSQSCGKAFHFIFGLIKEKFIENSHAQNESILIFCSV